MGIKSDDLGVHTEHFTGMVFLDHEPAVPPKTSQELYHTGFSISVGEEISLAILTVVKGPNHNNLPETSTDEQSRKHWVLRPSLYLLVRWQGGGGSNKRRS